MKPFRLKVELRLLPAPPMAMAAGRQRQQTPPLRLVVEASRGAVIAVHAAAGLARGHAQALSLLRDAEGL